MNIPPSTSSLNIGEFITRYYPYYGSQYCADKLNKSPSSIRHLASRMKISYVGWTDKEIQILKENYPKYSIDICGAMLSKSESIVYRKLKELKISTQRDFRFTPSQVLFLNKNYAAIGLAECSRKLNISSNILSRKVRKLKLKLNDDTRHKIYTNVIRPEKTDIEYKVNPSQFIDIISPEVAYILGIIWADGNIYKKGYQNRIVISCKSEDLDLLKNIFLNTGKWAMSYHTQENRKKQLTIGTSNKKLTNFLIENDYLAKSIKSADKILSRIPENIKHYWFRGLVDGDGCFYINKPRYLRQFSVTAPYNQDWGYLEKLCNSMNIKYVIKRWKQLQRGKIHCSSVLRITNKLDILKIGNYIYKNYNSDKIGLPRKYNKFIEIREF